MQKKLSSMSVGDIASLAIQVVQCVNNSNMSAAITDATFINLMNETNKISEALLRENNSELVALKDQISDSLFKFYLKLRRKVENEQHSPIDEVAENAKIVMAQFAQMKENVRTIKPNLKSVFFKSLIDKLKQEPIAIAVTKANLKPWVDKFEVLYLEDSRLTIDKRVNKGNLKSTATATSLKPITRRALRDFFNFVDGRCNSLNDEAWHALSKSIEGIELEVGRTLVKNPDATPTSAENPPAA